MRELKFRTYDFVMQRYDDAPEMYATTDGHLEPSGNKIIEQYTGLKDKNGKEIYDGDIVQDGRGEKCRVEWTKSETHFGLYVGKQMELTNFIWMRGEDLEVIGNIHENKELLEEE